MVSNDGLKKQASMVESIPYMLTKNVENGIPAFPSWALTHIGASTIYSHSSGVNQIGLISGKSWFLWFLLLFTWLKIYLSYLNPKGEDSSSKSEWFMVT